MTASAASASSSSGPAAPRSAASRSRSRTASSGSRWGRASSSSRSTPSRYDWQFLPMPAVATPGQHDLPLTARRATEPHDRRSADRLGADGGPCPGGDHRRRRRRDVDRVPPRRARLDRRRPRRPGRAHLRLDVPLGRARRPAPRLRDADEDDDVRRRAVPAARATRRASTRRGTRSGRSGSPRRGPASRSSSARPAGRKTFGLPIELISASEARDRFPLMSTDGVLGAVWLPTDGWLDPSGLAQALAAGARQRGRHDPDPHPRRRDRRRARPRDRRRGRAPRRLAGDDRGRRRRQRRRDVRPGDRPAGRRHDPDRADGPPVPLHRGDRRRPRRAAAAPRPGQPRLLPRGGRRAVHGRLRAQPGAVVARRRPAGLQRQAARARLAAVRGDHGRRGPARAGDRRRRRLADDQRARGLHARQRVHPRRDRTSAGSSSPPGSAPTGSPAPAGSAARSRRGSSTASRSSTCGTWTSGGSAAQHWRSREWTLARTTEVYATYYDIHYPNEERQAGRPLRTSPTYERLDGARRGLRREVRLGAARTGSSRTPTTRAAAAAPRSRLAAARLGRPALEPGDRRRGAGDPAGRRDLRRDELREDRGHRPRRGGVPGAAVRERGRRPGRARRLHLDAELARRDRDRPDRDPRRAGPLPPRHRDGVRPARPRLAPEAPAGRRQRRCSTTSRPAASASGCGARAPATSSRRSRPTTSRTRRSRS